MQVKKKVKKAKALKKARKIAQMKKKIVKDVVNLGVIADEPLSAPQVVDTSAE